MSDIYKHLNEAFDLSFLQSNEFPLTEIKNVGILGGGTAGYLTALALKTAHPNCKINLIESSQIPIIGVGESTTTEIVPFLHHFLGIDPFDFFKQVEPTLKLGIQFDWGEKNSPAFNFNFFASHHAESRHFENHINNSNLASVLINESKIPVLKDDQGQFLSLLDKIPFAYHLDNKKFVLFLRSQIDKAGIEIIDTQIQRVQIDNNGFVDHLVDKDKGEHKFDLYIDCSGFRSKLLGETLKTPFVSYEKTLITDRALTFNLPNHNKIDPFTEAISMKNGWCWKIPMMSENHYGYVFSSKFCSDDEALKEASTKFAPIDSYKFIPFRSGRFEKAWNKNVFAIGNAYAFVEPLESTAIQTVIHSIMLLCRLMPRSFQDTSSIQGINQEIRANWDSFRWFLSIHYKFNQKEDTPFWEWCRESVDIGHAQKILDLFYEKAPLSQGHYGTTSGYAADSSLVFNAYSYDSLLYGQNIQSHQPEVIQMDRQQYLKKVDSYKSIAQKALTQKELFTVPDLLYNELLPSLFETEDSWITDTSI